MKNYILALTSIAALTSCSNVPPFDFSSLPDVRGWKVNSDTIQQGNPPTPPIFLKAGMNDSINYSGSVTLSRTDPQDGRGSIQAFSRNPNGPSYVNFLSPDLFLVKDWQEMDGFSAQVSPPFISNYDYYGSLRVTVIDQTSSPSRERTLRSPFKKLNNNAWTKIEFNNIKSQLQEAGIDQYVVRNVLVRFDWADEIDSELIFVVDDVIPSTN